MTIDLRALIFDLDGVIADTNALHYRSWERLSQEEAIPFDHATYQQMMGLHRRACLNVFLNGRPVDEATVQDYLHRKNIYFLELLEKFTPADTAPGVRELIEAGRAAGLKIGLASSSQNARYVLQKLGLFNWFDVIGDGAAVTHHKPAPDIFLWTAEHLDVLPAQAVVFEDSRAGVEAARTGGFWVVGIGDKQVTDAHVIVTSLSRLHLSEIAAHLKSQN